MSGGAMSSQAGWHFAHKPVGVKTRDPIAGEFFASEAIDDAGTALVREAIQNSLDARSAKDEPVRIRLFVSDDRQALPPARHEHWFASAWPHLKAPRNGLRSDSLVRNGACRFLVCEDFGTTGLTGDPHQGDEVPGVRNAFFYFFRAEGRTDKHTDDRGRWGIGKQVFPRSSKAQMFFGYTESDHGGLLMGGCILKNHVVSGRHFLPDGYWGRSEAIGHETLVMPESDPGVIDRFRQDFMLERSSGQRGLSIVVPWIEDGAEESEGRRPFERDSLAVDVLSEYFLPIIEGRLQVSVGDSSGVHLLTSHTYADCLQRLRSASQETQAQVDQLASRIAVVERVRNHVDVVRVSVPESGLNRPQFTDDMLSREQAARLREALSSGKVLSVDCTMSIRLKAGLVHRGQFQCYLAKDAAAEQPCFIREDLLISDVRGRRTPGHTAIVRIDAGAVASMLGDAEGPAHTSWNKSSRNFKDKYVFGPGSIDFVVHFPEQLFSRIYGSAREVDRSLLLDLFHDTGPERGVDPKENDPNPGKKPPPDKGSDSSSDDGPIEPLNRKSRAVRVNMQESGFTVVPGEMPPPLGAIVVVHAAYSTTKGNAFRQYRWHDFSMNALSPRCTGCSIVRCRENYVAVRVTDGDFSVAVAGFDRNRDLEVKWQVKEGSETESAASE